MCQVISYGGTHFTATNNGTLYWQFTGISGKADEIWIQKQPGCTSTCSGHGTCSPVFHKCVCEPHFYGEDCSVFLMKDSLVPLNSANWKYNQTAQQGNWTDISFDGMYSLIHLLRLRWQIRAGRMAKLLLDTDILE